MNERRKSDRRIPPAVAQHAIEERDELLARIECLVSKNDTLNRANLELCDQLHSALKSQPRSVVLPEPFEMRPFQTVDQGSTNYKAGFNAALRKVRESIKSPTVSDVDGMCNADNPETRCICREELGHRVCVKAGSAGMVDERSPVLGGYAVVSLRKDGDLHIVIDATERLANARAQHWREKGYVSNVAPVMIPAARAAQPDHSAQNLDMAPESMRFQMKHPFSGEVRTIEFSRQEIADALEDSMYEKLGEFICQCESVGETNVVDCNCDEYTHDFDMLAAPTPGTETE